MVRTDDSKPSDQSSKLVNLSEMKTIALSVWQKELLTLNGFRPGQMIKEPKRVMNAGSKVGSLPRSPGFASCYLLKKFFLRTLPSKIILLIEFIKRKKMFT